MDPRYSPEPRNFSSQSSQQQSWQHQSHNRKLFIQRNSQEEQEIVIPYWDEESSSANYHLIEQIRLLKKKNVHFESHMGRMKAQYEQLRLNLQIMDQNQRESIRRFAQLTQRYNVAIGKIQELKGEVQILRNQNGELRGDLRVKEMREEEMRKKIARLKDQECAMNTRIMELEEELKMTTLRNEQQKRILQKSRHTELQILKQSLHSQPQAPVPALTPASSSNLTQIIAQLKSHVEDRDTKLAKLQKQHESLVNEIKIENIKLNDEKNYLQMKISKEEARVKEIKARQREREMRNRICSEITVNVPGDQEQKREEKGVKIEEYEALLEKLKAKEAEIRDLMEKVRGLESKLGEKEKQHEEIASRMKKDYVQATIKLEEAEKLIQALRQQIQTLKAYLVQVQQKQPEKAQPKQKSSQQQDSKTLSQLQAQYNSQLQALRRLILYKKYPQSQPEPQHKLRQQYQHKFNILVTDYQQLQKQLLLLQEQLLNQRQHHYNYQDSTREIITFRTSEEERIIYLQAIRKWEIAYEELNAIYEAKLVSKDEEINLLNLRLINRV